MFTDTGDGQVNSCTIRLEATRGKYIQQGVESKTKIVVNDRIRILATDGVGNTYNRVFDIVKLVPIKSKNEGTMLELNCLGIERWLQKVNYAKNTFNMTPKAMLADLVARYNEAAAIATNTPIINLSGGEISVNELPATTRLQEGWGNNEDTIFNRINELVDLMSNSQATGGLLDFFDVRFVSSSSNVTSFDVEVFSSGNAGRSKPSITLLDADVNLDEETEAGFDEPEGLLLNNWGENGRGTLPTNFSKFQARQEFMQDNTGSNSLFSEYDSTFTYQIGAIVKYTATAPTNDKVYKALRETFNDTPPASTSDWVALTTEAYYGTIKYSPWTDGRQTEWNNGGQNVKDTGFYGLGMWDGNIIIRSENAFRTWADVAELNPSSIDTDWLYSGTTLYDGLRCLVNGTGTGDFANWSNYIMEYSGEESKWIPKYQLQAEHMIVVFETGAVLRYTGSAYTNMDTFHNGFDCMHPMYNNTVIPVESVILNRSTGTATNYTGNINSAIQARYRYTPLLNWFEEWIPQVLKAGILGLAGAVNTFISWVTGGGTRNTSSWYSAGAWLSFRFPFPKNTEQIVGGSVGDVYGGSTSQQKVTHIDAQNMTYSADGKQGFVNGLSSEDLGPLSSIDFMMKIDFIGQELGTNNRYLLTKANFKMACYMIDKNDNVVKQDFVIPFNGEYAHITLPLSGFEIYRAQRPIYETTKLTSLIIPPKEIPSTAQFENRHIAMMCFQLQEAYDESGRYMGASGNNIGTGNLFFDKGDFAFFELDISIDGLRFAKPALVNSGAVSDLNNEPVFLQSPNIGNYEQLKRNVLSELEKAKFEKKQYDIVTDGDFKIQHGDFFVLEDDEIVEDTYLSVANRILLVAKHIEYSFTTGDEGTGGYKRRIIGAKRFI